MKHNIVFIDMNRIFGIPIRWGIPDNTKSSVVIDSITNTCKDTHFVHFYYKYTLWNQHLVLMILRRSKTYVKQKVFL